MNGECASCCALPGGPNWVQGNDDPARAQGQGHGAMPDELKAHARRIPEELLTQGDLAVADELLAPGASTTRQPPRPGAKDERVGAGAPAGLPGPVCHRRGRDRRGRPGGAAPHAQRDTRWRIPRYSADRSARQLATGGDPAPRSRREVRGALVQPGPLRLAVATRCAADSMREDEARCTRISCSGRPWNVAMSPER